MIIKKKELMNLRWSEEDTGGVGGRRKTDGQK